MEKPVAKRIVFVVTLLISSFDLQARKIECLAGEKIRIIETLYPEDNSGVVCNITYHKPTAGIASKIVWQARNDVNFCDNRAWFMANKLEKKGWTCNSVYEAVEDNEVIQSSLSINDSTSADVPTSPLTFRKFLEQQFEVDFQTKADYYYGKDQLDCIAADCKRFFDYRIQSGGEPQTLFGYKVSEKTKLWMDLECRGGHCWGYLYQEQADIEKLPLPEFVTRAPASLFLKSQHRGFPDLWLPVAHNSSNIVEVKLLRYQDGSYKTLAHLLAKSDPGMKAESKGKPAFAPGIVTLKANLDGESLELVYKTRDIGYEGLLLNPGN